ncbi:hypothetical protein FB567DRAFT_616193 [Paraphoma chrysanthemicola]|uniref:Uncharacterized protein n=1 Tax=Paraphoma chrysanthemicola TaxID=798071 RepID=A0A8K0QRF0_9PLEO|nr:hypothetical protein FB567DRAFT_616193 [Paraphoma chrysanthemicola]
MPTTTRRTRASRKELRTTFTAFTGCSDLEVVDYYISFNNCDIKSAINHYFDLDQPTILVQTTAVPVQQMPASTPNPTEGVHATAGHVQQSGDSVTSPNTATPQVRRGVFGGTWEVVLGRVTGITQTGAGLVLRTAGRALRQGYRGLVHARDSFQQARPALRNFGDTLQVVCFILLSIQPFAMAAMRYQVWIMWWVARRYARAIVRRLVIVAMRMVWVVVRLVMRR